MIEDRTTARILGLVLIVFSMLIDVSFFLFSGSARERPGFAAVVIVPSIPFFVAGALLLLRAKKTKP